MKIALDIISLRNSSDNGTWHDGRRKFALTRNDPKKASNMQKSKPTSNKQVQEGRTS